MHIRRLGWAGLELTSQDTAIAIDLVEDLGSMEQFLGTAREPLPQVGRPLHGALVTHLHRDHADPAALARRLAPDAAPVLRPPVATGSRLEVAATLEAEGAFAEHELATVVSEPWDVHQVGPFTITAVPAVDGFGDPQASWVVEDGEHRILHGGDTLFHGSWWVIAMRVGPIDAAFLPVNGAVTQFPHRQPPSPLNAVMDPRQAAVAARLLGVRLAVPIHYGAIHVPPLYAQVDDPAGSFLREADALGVPAAVVEPGAGVVLPEPAPAG